MTMNNVIRMLVMCSVMVGTSMMFAQAPAQNIDASKHPHLASTFAGSCVSILVIPDGARSPRLFAHEDQL